MIQSKLSLVSEVTIKLYNKHGECIESRVVPNIVTTIGKTILRSRMGSSTVGTYSPVQYIDIGTGDIAPALADTTITPTIPAATRQLATLGLFDRSYNTVAGLSTLTYNTVVWNGTFGAGNGTGTIREAGLFTNNTGGSLFARTKFTALTKGSTDSLTISWAITMTDQSSIFTVTGLADSKNVIIRNNGVSQTITSNGSYAQNGPLSVNIQPAGQRCYVATSSSIVCQNSYTVGGTMSGLGTGQTVQLALLGNNTSVGTISITANGTFKFGSTLITGTTYHISVVSVPAGKNISIGNDTGTIGTTDVTDVTVTVI